MTSPLKVPVALFRGVELGFETMFSGCNL